MANVLEVLKGFPKLYDIVTPDEVKYLFKAITDSKTYIKHVFRHELAMHSAIKVRIAIIK